MAVKSNQSRTRGKAANSKPSKPHPDFPLFPHATKRWAKKVRGKLHYFGRWDDPSGALERWLDQKDDLLAGRTPRTKDNGLTIRELCNRFLTSKQHQLDTGELAPRSFRDYKSTTDRLIAVFGKSRLVDDLAADDFEMLRADIAKTRGVVSVGNEITRIRVVFNFAYDNHLIEQPIRYGSGFKRPTKKTLRKERANHGKRMFEKNEILAMLDAAGVHLRAMVLLGINSGFGNSDCGTLSSSAVDLENGWIDYPRPKTGIERRCPLWEETVTALQASLALRPAPRDDQDADLVFITAHGGRWAKETADSPITKETRKLLDKLGIHRRGLGFYALRHTFRTVADETRDFVAANHIIGHADDSMAAVYRERTSDQRLRAVADHVRKWLLGDDASEGSTAYYKAAHFGARKRMNHA